jgi:hypothetical protein
MSMIPTFKFVVHCKLLYKNKCERLKSAKLIAWHTLGCDNYEFNSGKHRIRLQLQLYIAAKQQLYIVLQYGRDICWHTFSTVDSSAKCGLYRGPTIKSRSSSIIHKHCTHSTLEGYHLWKTSNAKRWLRHLWTVRCNDRQGDPVITKVYQHESST